MRTEAKNLAEIAATIFSKRPEIVAAYMYGSQVNGTATEKSDYDIAVLLNPNYKNDALYKYMFDLNERVLEATQKKVEVIPTRVMSYPLKYRSVLFGKLIYSRDEKLRIKEEMKLENAYEDLRDLYELRYNKIVKAVGQKLYDR